MTSTAPPATPSSGAAASTGHRRGTPGYRRLVGAVWAAGVGCFTLLYGPQALLPLLVDDLEVSAATSALVISLSTGALALALVPMSLLAERVGRLRLMTVCLTAAAVLGLLCPLSPGIEVLLVLRTLQGVAIAGLPALAMAHLSEEVEPRAVGGAMGLYVAGNTIGGLSGRVVASTLGDAVGWRWGFAALGVIALASTVAMVLLMPAPLARTAPAGRAVVLGHLVRHLRDPGVRRLCATSLLVMGAFVTVYNFLGFRLLAEPFGLSQTLVGLVFLTYLCGTLSAPAMGGLGDRVGRRTVLMTSVLVSVAAVALTLTDVLALVLLGLALFTVGFFGAHTSASGMVGNRARTGRSQASALYLLAYYAGSSVGGWGGGLVYGALGWDGVVGYVLLLLGGALVAALLLARTPPLAASPAAAAGAGT